MWKAPEEFEINMLRCIYCGYVEVCPEGLFFYKMNTLVRHTWEEMINNKAGNFMSQYLPDPHYKWDKKKKAEARAPLSCF